MGYYVGVSPTNTRQVFNVDRSPKDAVSGITVSVTGNPALDSAIYWGALLGLGYLAFSIGYEVFTGHKFLPSGRTPAAWEVFG